MTLENIVPPLEDCKRIPEGAFKDSAFVWGNKYVWERREALNNEWHTSIIPAPSLEEILDELPYGTTVMLDAPNTWVCINRDKRINITKAENPATAALRLLERINNKDGE